MNVVKSVIVWITAICFLGIFFPVSFLTWLIAWPFDRNKSIIHWLIVFQSMAITFLVPVWKIRIEGRDRVAKKGTYVYFANHQSILDILLINCLRYRFRWISKIENMSVPVLGWYLRMADYITVNRGNDESKAEMLMRSYRSLKDGISIMIFPEGTRSTNGEIGFFRRGAFQLAIEAGVTLVPILIDGTADILPKHGLKFRSGYHVNIRVLDPVVPANFGTENPEVLAAAMSDMMKSELRALRSEKTAG
jgi:1-acyl-sn-glycerol-3-phosphate acyltransferase